MNKNIKEMDTTELIKPWYDKLEDVPTGRNTLNKRYKTFCQVFYTTGDEEQFFDETEGKISSQGEYEINEEGAIEYRLNGKSIIDSFRYHFHNLKKGIFVSIRNNKVKFIPFSKYNFINNWGEDVDTGNLADLFKRSQSIFNRAYKPYRLMFDPEYWVGNGFNIRYENPLNEGDSNVSVLYHMFTELLKQEKVPDIDFILNRRDFPIIRKDGHFSYPVLSRKYLPYPVNGLPVLSMCTHKEYQDIPICTHETWKYVVNDEGKIFTSSYINRKEQFVKREDILTDFNCKKMSFVFRGSSTGQGVDMETNMRVKLLKLADDPLISQYMDVGITSWNARIRFLKDGTLNTFSKELVRSIPLAKFLSLEEQSKYKFIINIEGHVNAFRLAKELSLGSVILLQECDYKAWFFKYLKPGIHFLPLKKDLSNLIETVLFCVNDENHEELELISKNSLEFYKTYFSKENILRSLSNTLKDIRSKSNRLFINSLSYRDIINSKVRSHLKTIPTINYTDSFQELHTSRFTNIYENECGIIKKIYKKKEESEYEIFVASKLSKYTNITPYIPKFIGKEDGNVSFWKKQEGIPLFKYLNENILSLKSLKDIYTHIMHILQLFYDNNISHNDTYTWNIMIKDIDRPMNKIFNLSSKRHELYTNYNISFVDLGKTSFVEDNIIYGYRVRPTEMLKCRNWLIFTISFINTILSKGKVEKDILSFIFKICNTLCNIEPLFTGTSEFNTIKELKKFLKKSRKFTYITYVPKGNIERYSSLDFIRALENKTMYSSSYMNITQSIPEFIFKNKEDLLDKIESIKDNSFYSKSLLLYSRLIIEYNIRMNNYEYIDKAILDLIKDKITRLKEG